MENSWDGVTMRGMYKPEVEAERDELASAARDGRWDAVVAGCERSPALVNSWRLGGTSWFTVLHQAAWHGADQDVVARLVALEPWLTQRTAAGDRALDIAVRHGHRHLVELLVPVVRTPLLTEVVLGVQRNLHALILERAEDLVTGGQLRMPELDVLTEMAEPSLGFTVPGMYGGFYGKLEGSELVVDSWCRIVGGSGQTHRVGQDGYVMTASGFV